MFTCSFCDSVFKTSGTLRSHRTTAKYCLEIQLNKKIKCLYCGGFIISQTHISHQAKCRQIYADDLIKEKKIELVQKDKEITSLREVNQKLLGKIEVLEKQITKPNVVNNIKYINPKILQIKIDTIKPFTTETIQEALRENKFTYDMYTRGINGLVEFFSNIVMKGNEKNYACSDSSRDSFYRLLETRLWEPDKGGIFLDTCLNLNDLKDVINAHDLKVMEEPDLETRDIMLDKVKPIYFGITRHKGTDREKLTTRLRKNLRKMVMV